MTSFGPYAVLDRLGQGATGTVYRAQAPGTGRFVAVKELSGPLRNDPVALERLRREARLLTGLSHPNLVGVHEFVEERERAWLVCDYVDGAELSRVLAVHGRLSPEDALAVLHGALTGLAFAHRHGIVHGDVSLDNLMLATDGTSKLLDFGLATPTGGTGIGGTPAFASPEAVTGRPRTPASDVYSAAAVLWTLLAGRPPFPGTDAAVVARAQVEQPPPLLEGHGPELAGLLDRAMAKNPAVRPPDAGAFLAELEAAAGRRYGADWLTRASVSGLAATAAGGVAVAVAGGGSAAAPVVIASSLAGTAAPAAPLTASVEGAVAEAKLAGAAVAPPPAAPAMPPPGQYLPVPPPVRAGARQSSRLQWLAGGGVAAAAAVVVVVVVLLTTGNDAAPGGTTAAGGSTSAGAGSGSATPAAEEPALPSGAYAAGATVVIGHPSWENEGTTESATWTITLDCAASPCSGSFTLPDGSGTLAYDGTTLRATGTRTIHYDCVDSATGELVPGSSLTAGIQFTATFAVGEASGGQRPSFTGTETLNWTTQATTGGCRTEPDGTTSRQVTLTPA